MSYNYNYCVLIGRVTKDPEFKVINDKFCVLNFTIAITRRYRKDSGVKDADFIPVTITGNNASIGSNLISKGVPLLVWGSIQVRSYDKSNERRWITEVIAENFQILSRYKKATDTEDNLDTENLDYIEEKISSVIK